MNLSLWFLLLALAAAVQSPKSKVQSRGPEQSAISNRQSAISFSHKQHASIGLDCAACHEMPGTGERAGLPATETCMACHQSVKKDAPAIRRLADYHRKKEPIPWVRLYRLPDFVFFSHRKHVDAKTECTACHGDVPQRDVLHEEKPATTMAFCVECHKEKKASMECNLCHELK